MNRFRAALLAVLTVGCLLSFSQSLFAQQKTVHVKGYTKKDGTVVAPYDRRAPGTATPSAPAPSPAPASAPASSTSSATTAGHPESYCSTCARDSEGRILRGKAALDAFKKQTGYPHGRPGYVVDHVIPLACGGEDVTANMQWQTTADAKAKDKVERRGCTK